MAIGLREEAGSGLIEAQGYVEGAWRYSGSKN